MTSAPQVTTPKQAAGETAGDGAMARTVPARRRPRGGVAESFPYLALWATLMGTASMYLASLLIIPDTVSEILPPIQIAGAPDADVRRSLALAEAERLRGALEEARRQIASLEAAKPADRLSDAVDAPHAVAAGPMVRPGSAEPERPELRKLEPGERRYQIPQGLTGRPGIAAAPVQTGSVPLPARPPVSQAPVARPESVKSAEAGGLGLMLASGPSIDSLRLSWSLLSERHGPLLKTLQPRYVAGGDPAGSSFDLVAGPIASQDEANRLCADLKAKRVACRIGSFAGNAL